MRKLKLSKNMKPYISLVSTNGPIQNAFADQIGKPVGACVSNQTKGKVGILSGAQMHNIVRGCAKQAKKELAGNFIHGKGEDARVARLRRKAAVTA